MAVFKFANRQIRFINKKILRKIKHPILVLIFHRKKYLEKEVTIKTPNKRCFRDFVNKRIGLFKHYVFLSRLFDKKYLKKEMANKNFA